jgi:SNF2 family DNA or RNA helicase
MDPSWNISKLNQIMGRAIRFCSHKDVPKIRRHVEVYLYLATYPNINTIDSHIWINAKKKSEIIKVFENKLKENAFDCKLFYNRNSYKTDEMKLKCN